MKKAHSSITNKLTLHARKSISHAEKIASAHDAPEVRPEHLLYGVFLERGSVGATILSNIGLNKEIFEKEIFAQKLTPKKILSKVRSSHALKKIITDAHALAAEFGYVYVGTEHLIYALLNTKYPAVQTILDKARPKKNPNQNPYTINQTAGLFGIENLAALMNGERDTNTESALEHFCTNIADQKPEPFVGRQSDIERIVTILGRRIKNNPLIIGEPGIGKTAIIEHIAHLAKDPDAPHYLYGKEIITLDLTLLVAGTSFRGEFEQRLKSIIAEAQENENIILFIDEIHTIIGTGNTGGSLDAANILKPALSRGNIRIIGATTLGEYKKHIEKDPALVRRFQKVILTEPTATDTRTILHGIKQTYEKHHGVQVPDETIDAIIQFSDRYLPEQFFPDKAIDLLDETAARLCTSREKNDIQKQVISLENDLKEISAQKSTFVHAEKYDDASKMREVEDALTQEIRDARALLKDRAVKNQPLMTIDDVAHTIAINTGIPKNKLLQNADAHIVTAQKKLSQTIIGQDHAIKKIADTLIRSASGLSNPNRPHGSFLFLGSTGTGKTFTAQTLATELYDARSLIRVDMSELMERHHTSKLLGAPAGYIGYGEGGTLTEKVRRNPHSVVLFDEVEKAHPDVFNILLQILEDGTLTDAGGRVINFKNTIIILTSNAGSASLTREKKLGFDKSTHASHAILSQKILRSTKDILPPELLSRLDHIIVFHQLSQKELQKITRIAFGHLANRLKKRSIALSVKPHIITHIAKQAYEKNDGARGIRQIIQEEIESMIAHHVIAHPHVKKVTIDYIHDTITLS
jgi:ATP-dependent Clp protease ATP-binding subunit ClpC